MSTIYIENRPYELPSETTNLLEVCLSLGFDIPYFCWHPALHSVGACRQCAVKLFKDEHDTAGRLIMSCMTQATDGMRISISDPEAVEFRAKVIEWLMLNHPHDCPVCDEGGSCHLQDMTVMTGHVYRRNRFAKRTYRNQDLGPFINHEMNRCIHCYRCARFYRGYAGGRDFEVFGCHDHVYFGRFEDGPLESVFSGNLVEVCPTGVFTDKTLKRHYARAWDMQTAPSVCVHCGLGCNTIPGERYGILRQVRARFNNDINRYFLCDRGRFGYEFVNSDTRIRQPLVRRNGKLEPASPAEAMAAAVEILKSSPVFGVASPRASMESNFALRQLVGEDRLVQGMTAGHERVMRSIVEVLKAGPTPGASLSDADHSDAVFVLGEDVTNTAPMLALSLRQAVLEKPMSEAAARQKITPWEDAVLREAIQQEHGPFYVASPDATKLDNVASLTWRAAPDDLARLGFAVAHAIDPEAPDVPGLTDEIRSIAREIADKLLTGSRPLVVSGITCGSERLIQAAANVAWALYQRNRDTRLCFTVPDCNSVGLSMLGGRPIEDVAEQFDDGRPAALIVVENDIYRHLGRESADRVFSRAAQVIAIDSIRTATTDAADVVFPAATFAECTGTLINNEGRAQRFFQVFVPEGEVRASWRWLSDLIVATRGAQPPWSTLDEVVDDLVRSLPHLEGVRKAALPASFLLDGQKVPRQHQRHSGRTAERANVNVQEQAPPPDPDAPLGYTTEGSTRQPPPSLVSRFWAPGWNSPNAVTKYQRVVDGPLKGGKPGCMVLHTPTHVKPAYFDELPKPFARRQDQWLIVPACHCFGSEELSSRAQAVAELRPQPYLALNSQDADRLGILPDEAASLAIDGLTVDLPVRITTTLPAGVAAVPVGLPEMPEMPLPAWGKICPLGRQEAGGG